MVVAFKSRLLQIDDDDDDDDDDVLEKLKSGTIRPPLRRCIAVALRLVDVR
jgi:hypothetical protein